MKTGPSAVQLLDIHCPLHNSCEVDAIIISFWIHLFKATPLKYGARIWIWVLDLRSHIHEHCVLSGWERVWFVHRLPAPGIRLLHGVYCICLTTVLIKREIFFSDTVLFPKVLEQSARGPGWSLFPLRDQLSAMVREWCLHPGIVGLIGRSSTLCKHLPFSSAFGRES